MFKLGDKVKWESQSQGSSKKKEGIIIEVVPSGTSPKLHAGDIGQGRVQESYVVKVGKSKTYWPLVIKLRIVS